MQAQTMSGAVRASNKSSVVAKKRGIPHFVAVRLQHLSQQSLSAINDDHADFTAHEVTAYAGVA
jgi:hypothetical protein